jgi:hypothetical protein
MQTVRAELVVLSTSWVRTSRVLSNPFLSFLFRFKQHPFTTRLGTFLLHMHQSLDSPSRTALSIGHFFCSRELSLLLAVLGVPAAQAFAHRRSLATRQGVRAQLFLPTLLPKQRPAPIVRIQHLLAFGHRVGFLAIAQLAALPLPAPAPEGGSRRRVNSHHNNTAARSWHWFDRCHCGDTAITATRPASWCSGAT